jgi:hypothetical protein
VTKNLGQVNAWWIRDNRILELGWRDAEHEIVYDRLEYDEGCGTLVSDEPMGGAEWYPNNPYFELNLSE